MKVDLSEILSHPFFFVLRRPQKSIQVWFGSSAPTLVNKGKNYDLFAPGYFEKNSPLIPEGKYWSFSQRANIDPNQLKRESALTKSECMESPNRDEWKKYCEKIEEQLREENLEKVVPARTKIYKLSLSPPEKKELLGRLFEEESQTIYPFFLKWPHGYFMGKTPELLFHRIGDRVRIPVIAGTRTHRGEDRESQAKLLLGDAKETREHELVAKGILSALKDIGLKGRRTLSPEPLFLKSLVHLRSEIEVEAGGIDSEVLVKALHPTPAVGGIPMRNAWEFIRSHESEPRDYFSSPLLVKDGDEALCLVAIRSALVAEDRVRIYAGAGYVRGSDPEREWNETAAKMKTMEDLIYGP